MTCCWPPAARRAALIAVACLSLVGCADLAQPPSTPVLPVAHTFGPDAEPNAPAAALLDAAQLGWREHFTDPSLQAVIAQALDHNRDLRVALARVDEARAVYAVRRSEGLPNVSAQATVQRARVPAALSSVGRPVVGDVVQLSAGLASWELDLWGAVRQRNEAALQSYLATDASQRAATLSLIAQVANSYLALRETDERLALARRTVASRQESLRITTRRLEVGATSRLNWAQVQTLLTQAQALAAQLAQARDAQDHALTLLVGTPVSLPPSDAALDVRLAAAPLRAGLPSDLLRNRPDILAAEHQLRASDASIATARAAYFPRVALTGSAGLASNALDGLFAAGTQAWSFAPAVSLPLFDGGARNANLQAAQARRAAALAAYDKAVQSAFRDVADALSAQRWLTEQLAIADAALAAQSERARLTQLRFDNGAAPFMDVLDAQRELLQAQQQQVQSRRALLSNRVALYAALGGGSLTMPDHDPGSP